MREGPRILIVAGELSGDQHAARILRGLKEECRGVSAWGFGGDHLAAEGMELRRHTRDLAVMGIAEVLRRYGYFRRVFGELVAEVRANRPDLILLVDYPGFNLRFAAAVRGLGVPVAHYICPQVWAWKSSRIPKMAEVLDRLLCIFPFEPAVFEGTGLSAVYCGHPLVEETREVRGDRPEGEGPVLALAPGSRLQEVDRLYPPMLEALVELRERMPGLRARTVAADEGIAARLRELEAAAGLGEAPEMVTGWMREVVKGSDAAWVTSGTATLETALLGTPMVVVYKTSPLTYAVGRRVVKVPHIGMVNLVAGREVCPELIQGEARPERLVEEVEPLLRDTPARAEMLKALRGEVREKLISDEGGRKPARYLLEMLPERLGGR